MNYSIFYKQLLYAFGILLCSIQIGFAQAPNSGQVAQPIQQPLPSIKIHTLKKHHTVKPTDISKSGFVSYYEYAPTIQNQKIAAQYFRDNAFDIGSYDNPFALQGSKTKKNRLTTQKTKNTKSIFSDLLAFNGKDNNHKIPKWLIFVLLGILSFMTILLSLYRRTVSNLLRAFFTLGVANNIYRDQNSFLKIESFSSYILFTLSMGTFVFILPLFLAEQASFNTLGGLLLCILGVGGLYILKHTQLKILSLILPYPHEINFYSFIVSITNKAIGYFLIPALFVLAYAPPSSQIYVLYFILTTLLLIYAYRSIRAFVIGTNAILFHKFHFFIYLCTVEIAPVVILLKLLSIF